MEASSSQGTGVRLDPLVDSMQYPDRKVRFEAAFALASGLPLMAALDLTQVPEPVTAPEPIAPPEPVAARGEDLIRHATGEPDGG